MGRSEKLKILITVKTYPIPSRKYDELVCTAGITDKGDLVRLYPINFRDLPFSKQYHKYQWIAVEADKHEGRDVRKESYRPHCDSITTLGPPISTTKGDWSERAQFIMPHRAPSMEHLCDEWRRDRTSLGFIKPKKITDLIITPDAPDWRPAFKQALLQSRLWETRTVSKEPPRKVPYRFQYRFECDDPRCNGHEMTVADWEVGALFWRLVDKGASQEEAADKVKKKFLDELCGPDKDTHFFVGTILAYPSSWIVIGVYWPKIDNGGQQRLLFTR